MLFNSLILNKQWCKDCSLVFGFWSIPLLPQCSNLMFLKCQREGMTQCASTLAPNVPRLELLTELSVPVCKSSEISGKQHKASFQYLETLLEITCRLSLNVCWHWYYQEAEEFSRTKKHWEAMQSCCLNCIFLNIYKNILTCIKIY